MQPTFLCPSLQNQQCAEVLMSLGLLNSRIEILFLGDE